MIGLVGNSGNSNEPHLHVHAQRPAAAGHEPLSGDPYGRVGNSRIRHNIHRVYTPTSLMPSFRPGRNGGSHMRQLVGYAGVLAVTMAIAPWVAAHHGFGTFLMNKDIEITGTVTRLDFVNPHSWLYLDVTQPDGKVVAVRCEMRSATTLRRSGWTPDLFPVG